MKNILLFQRVVKYIISNVYLGLRYSSIVFCLFAFSFEALHAQEYVLKHSYTFDDGTAKDVIGSAHGTIYGGQVIAGEFVTFSQGQYVELPAEKIKINTYPSFTLEAYIGAGHLNGFYTSFSYFGNAEGDLGTNYIFQSIASGGRSETSISCKNSKEPWAVSTNVFSKIYTDSKYHHVVTTFDDHEIKFYIDGVLVGTNAVDQFPENKIANIGNQLAYLCKSGYKANPTWYGSIDQFNIYEGILDAKTIAHSAREYLEDAQEFSTDIKKLQTNSLQNPGFRPESDLSETFIKTFRQAKFIVHPTIVRTVDSTSWSPVSAQQITTSLQSDLQWNVQNSHSILDPGKLEGPGQFGFFTNDLNHLSGIINENKLDADYHLILEVLFPPQQTERIFVFGIHFFILDDKGENAFSFLLNTHHDYFSFNCLMAENAKPENVEMLILKCSRVAIDALKKQIEYAENEVIN